MAGSASSEQSASRVARVVELGSSFQVVFVFGPQHVSRAVVADAAARASRARQEPINLLWFLPKDAATKAATEENAKVKSVWVLELYGPQRDSERQLRELNRTRDSMARSGSTTLVLMLDEKDGALPAEHAPDLWSIRTFALALAGRSELDEDHGVLSKWRDDCAAAFESKLEGSAEARSLYSAGTYRFSYRVRDATPLTSSASLRQLMSSIRGWTGWRPWWVPENTTRPYSADEGVLECWMIGDGNSFRDPAHADFWRASQQGLFYLVRGYGEDSTDKQKPGTVLSFSLLVWRVGEALFHAKQVAERLAPGLGVVDFSASWSGLVGRRPTDWPSRTFDIYEFDAEPTRRERVLSSLTFSVDELEQDLGGVVERVLHPLYDAFMAAPLTRVIEAELDEMRSRPVRG